jgi:hypothetical protein
VEMVVGNGDLYLYLTENSGGYTASDHRPATQPKPLNRDNKIKLTDKTEANQEERSYFLDRGNSFPFATCKKKTLRDAI